ncbi:30S ribosomal protein S20 [Hyphomicrobiales bacterium]|nr:30S ribosomal protein S20 [Hyphomicrobiales bacterium]
MANTKSAKKMVRKIATRTLVNKMRRNKVRTSVRKAEEAIASGDKALAQEALKAAQPELMRGAQKGAFNRKQAARKISRLTKRIINIAP